MRSPCRPRTIALCENALAALEGLGEREYTLEAVVAVPHDCNHDPRPSREWIADKSRCLLNTWKFEITGTIRFV
jgi:hypothetical protein